MGGRVYITGVGCVTALGLGVEATLKSILAGKHGVSKTQWIDTIHAQTLPFAEIPYHDQALAERLGIHDTDAYTRTTLLSLLAANEAVQHAGWNENAAELRSGVISGTTVGGMSRTEVHYYQMQENDKLHWIHQHDCGDSTERLADFLQAKSFVSTISTACSSAANALLLGARLIKAGILDRVVAGGADALSKFTINGFNTLKILDENHCRPFDHTRTGLNLGEGAGFVVLESEDVVMKSGKKVLCELKGYGNACDAYHQTASSPEGNGAFLAMEQALRLAQIQPEEIGYVNAHGTGTPNNDLSEGKALHRIFNGKVPPFSSTKAFTGHTLGAAGGIEAVLSTLSITQGIIFPNLNFANPMEDMPLVPETALKQGVDIRHVLSNSFGFGGNNSALVFSKV